MTLLLDAGAFIAVERGNRQLLHELRRERRLGRTAVTHGGVVGQVWRDGRRQAQLARMLAGVRVTALDDSLGRRAGGLMAVTGTTDVVDAALVSLAHDDDAIATSDPRDIARLALAARVLIRIFAV